MERKMVAHNNASRRQALGLLGAGALSALAVSVPTRKAHASLNSIRVGVHGSSVQVEHPERLEQKREATAAAHPIRLGFHSHFIGERLSDNWFHYAIPSLLLAEGGLATVRVVTLGFRTRADGVLVDRVDFWAGHRSVATTGTLRPPLSGDFRDRAFTPAVTPFRIDAPLGISIHVRFPGTGTLTPSEGYWVDFAYAYADITFAPR